MLRIRLRRVGKKKQAMYRIVVADSRAPRDGAFVEVLGQYYPLNNPSTIELDEERARHWLGRGARPSDRVSKLLAIKGLAEVPPKLKKRIELGAQRAKDAESQKVKAKAETAKAEAEAPPAAASAAEPAAETPAPEPAEPEAAGAEEEQAEA